MKQSAPGLGREHMGRSVFGAAICLCMVGGDPEAIAREMKGSLAKYQAGLDG
jgi:hypothetical protein